MCVRLKNGDDQVRHHPDDHSGLVDWQLYGPKDPEITDLVYRLAYEKNLRLQEIEDVIKTALQNKIHELGD